MGIVTGNEANVSFTSLFINNPVTGSHLDATACIRKIYIYIYVHGSYITSIKIENT